MVYILKGDFALLAGLFDHADEHVFEREASFARLKHADPGVLKPLAVDALAGFGVIFGDDVQAVAKERHAPALGIVLQQVHRALRLIDDEFEQMTALTGFDSGGAAFGHQFARDHEAQAIALFGFFQIVSGDENRGAGVGEAVDHGPEGAAGERIDAGGRFVEEQHAWFVQDRRAEGNALLPALRQAAGQLVFFALQTRERKDPALLLFALLFRNAVDSGEKVQVFLDGHVVIERKLLRHVADLFPDFGRAESTGLPGQLHASAGLRQQSAEHLDGGGFAGSVRAQQTVDFAVFHMGGHVFYGGERAELLHQIFRADRDLAA